MFVCVAEWIWVDDSQDFVFRNLWRKEKKLRKQSKAGTNVIPPTITVQEIQAAFPKASDSYVRARLKEKCLCVPFRDMEADGVFCLREVSFSWATSL